MEKETINGRIREILEKEGHTVSSFAKKIGIGDQTIRSIVKDRNKPSYDILVKILESFNEIDANWLIMGKKKVSEDKNQKHLYMVLEAQQKTIESQQKTIDRLTAKLIQDLPEESSKKVAVAG